MKLLIRNCPTHGLGLWMIIQKFYAGLILHHYCRMLLTRHYDQRPFDKIVCDALIANGDVKKPSKRCKTFAMAETSNMVQILVACAMQGTRLIHPNYLR